MGVTQQVGDGVKLVFLFVKDIPNSGIDKDFEAMNAGGMRHVYIGIADSVAVSRCLRDRVYLRVNSTVAVLFNFTIRCA